MRVRSSHPTPSAWVVPLVGTVILLASVPPIVNAQEERPDVHADFRYDVFPYDPVALARFETADARFMLSAFHKGWNLDKYLKETETSEADALTLLQGFEDDNLVRGRTDRDLRPGFPILREDEIPDTAALISETAAGLARVIEAEWTRVEELVSSLEVGQELPRDEVLYRVVVGGLLFGGMVDALFDDKTLMPAPPQRAGRRDSYYAWMTEGEAGPPQLIRQSAQVGRHLVISIGPVPVEKPRVEIRELAVTDPVYEYDDARRLRVFGRVTSRDHLLPYFKTQRSAMLQLNSELEASKYTAFAEFVAWFYVSSATEAAGLLVERGRIRAPETSFRYAVLSDR
jgi:hypothetical protein